MFTKKPDNEEMGVTVPKPISQHPAPPPAAAPMGQGSMGHKPSLKGSAKMVPSIIGADLTITGNIVSKGEVQVDGSIEGDLYCSSLIIGEKAEINGMVIADDVVVRGQVTGSIHGVRVTLQASSQVHGDVSHQSLAIEQGAFFEGKSRRSDDPVGSAPKLENPISTSSSTSSTTSDSARSSSTTGSSTNSSTKTTTGL